MNELLTSYSSLCRGVEDTIYYHLVDKATGVEAYVFSEYNAFFASEKDKIVGKCFYLQIPKNEECYCEDFKTKIIAGNNFINLGYKKCRDDYVVNPDSNIKNFVSQYFASSGLLLDNIFASNYSCFDEDLVAGVSIPRDALKKLYARNKNVREIVDEITSSFQIGIEDLGITGSLALGSVDASDYDIVFYGNTEKLNDIKRKIDYLRNERGSVDEYGLNWACRYYDSNANLICCFFVCTDYDYEAIKNAVIIDNNYVFDVTVSNDQHSNLKAPVLEINSTSIASLIVFNSGFKGVFRVGDRVQGCGKLIKYAQNGSELFAILCLNPYDEIYNYAAFFNRQ